MDKWFWMLMGFLPLYLLNIVLEHYQETSWLLALKDYQTLVAGILALLGAAWSVSYIRAQMAVQEKEIADLKKKEERRALASLPSDLSDILRLVDSVFEMMMIVLNRKNIDPIPNPKWQSGISSIQDSQMRRLTLAAAATEGELAEYIFKMLHEYQVMVARAETAIDRIERPIPGVSHGHDSNACSTLTSAAIVKYLAEKALEESREDTVSRSALTEKAVFNIIQRASISKPLWSALVERNRVLLGGREE